MPVWKAEVSELLKYTEKSKDGGLKFELSQFMSGTCHAKHTAASLFTLTLPPKDTGAADILGRTGSGFRKLTSLFVLLPPFLSTSILHLAFLAHPRAIFSLV